MTPETFSAEIFMLAVFVAALTFVRWHLYESYRVDAFRQRLFEIREELFDLAAEGAIAFDAPAYTKLRERLNRLIRLAHTYSLIHLLLVIALEGDGAKSVSDLDNSIAGVEDAEVRRRLERLNHRTSIYFGWHLICSSWVWLTIGLVGVAISHVGAQARGVAERCITSIPGMTTLERHTLATG